MDGLEIILHFSYNSKKFETNADGVIVSDNGSNNLNLHTNRFIVNRDEAFYFDQNNTGNAFIFRVSDSSALDTNVIKLEANGTMYNTCRSSSTTNITLRKGNNSADGIDYVQARANNNDLKFKVEGDGDVRNANNSYGSSSDSKLKENIVDANSQWADIKAVKVRNFNFISDSAKTKMIGVVAQELETVSAGLVSESIDRDPDTGERSFNNEGKHLESELDKSLKRLGIECVDLFYIHRRDDKFQIEEANLHIRKVLDMQNSLKVH
mgnify:CR=1 FL=1